MHNISLRHLIPKPIRIKLGFLYSSLLGKNKNELRYWKGRWQAEGKQFNNDFYQSLMLSIAGESDSGFLKDKVVGDFGCGPRGSLEWAKNPRERIGIDVQADVYVAKFDLSGHSMKYVTSTEKKIPLPCNYFDVLYCVNAIDHVKHFELICRELLRILKPSGDFIASINLGEPPSNCEPQCLSEEMIHTCLLKHLNVKSYRLTEQGPPDNKYKHAYNGHPLLDKLPEGSKGLLWVRATKPAE